MVKTIPQGIEFECYRCGRNNPGNGPTCKWHKYENGVLCNACNVAFRGYGKQALPKYRVAPRTITLSPLRKSKDVDIEPVKSAAVHASVPRKRQKRESGDDISHHDAIVELTPPPVAFTLDPWNPWNVKGKNKLTEVEYKAMGSSRQKYAIYGKAFRAFVDDRRTNGHSINHIVVIGAGSGGLIKAAMSAVPDIDLSTFTAIDINPVAIKCLNDSFGSTGMEIRIGDGSRRPIWTQLHNDGLSAPDLLLSELLGSAGDNEGAPEILKSAATHISRLWPASDLPAMIPTTLSILAQPVFMNVNDDMYAYTLMQSQLQASLGAGARIEQEIHADPDAGVSVSVTLNISNAIPPLDIGTGAGAGTDTGAETDTSTSLSTSSGSSETMTNIADVDAEADVVEVHELMKLQEIKTPNSKIKTPISSISSMSSRSISRDRSKKHSKSLNGNGLRVIPKLPFTLDELQDKWQVIHTYNLGLDEANTDQLWTVKLPDIADIAGYASMLEYEVTIERLKLGHGHELSEDTDTIQLVASVKDMLQPNYLLLSFTCVMYGDVKLVGNPLVSRQNSTKEWFLGGLPILEGRSLARCEVHMARGKGKGRKPDTDFHLHTEKDKEKGKGKGSVMVSRHFDKVNMSQTFEYRASMCRVREE